MKNLLVAQSGGPSVAINATLAGVVEKAMTNQNVGKIYGAKNGIMGILTDKLIDLTEALEDPETLQLLCQTPSSALGSCRMKLSDWEESTFEYDKILGIMISVISFISVGMILWTPCISWQASANACMLMMSKSSAHRKRLIMT